MLAQASRLSLPWRSRTAAQGSHSSASHTSYRGTSPTSHHCQATVETAEDAVYQRGRCECEESIDTHNWIYQVQATRDWHSRRRLHSYTRYIYTSRRETGFKWRLCRTEASCAQEGGCETRAKTCSKGSVWWNDAAGRRRMSCYTQEACCSQVSTVV